MSSRKRGIDPVDGRKPRIFGHFIKGAGGEIRKVWNASVRENKKYTGLGQHSTKPQAQAAIDAYLADGTIRLHPGKQSRPPGWTPPAKAAKPKRTPKPAPRKSRAKQPSFQREKTDMPPISSRHQQPGETRTDWMRRLFDLSERH